MKKTIVLWIVIGLALLLSVVAVTRPATVREFTNQIGAQPGADSEFSRRCDVGVCRNYYRANFAIGTTTACAFKSPNATSSVMFFYAQPRTATSTAFTAVLATSTVSNVSLTAATGIATTSMLTWMTYAANSAATFSYAPFGMNSGLIAGTGSTTQWILAPNTWMVYAAEGGGVISSGQSAAQIGSCTAMVVEL